jgi:hypothetical protein
MRGLDSFETQNDGIDEGQYHFAHAVLIVALVHSEFGRNGVLETYACEKPMEQVYSTKVS